MHRSAITTLAIALSLLAAGAGVSACSHNPPPGGGLESSPDSTRTFLVVDNQSYLDRNIWISREGQRVRLGLATAHTRQRFRIPNYLVYGISSLRVIAEPVGSRVAEVSNEVSVAAGDEVLFTIPPGS